jgi:hypothetical protein
MKKFNVLILALGMLLLGGCVTPPHVDYTTYKQMNPKSILVLPPLNNSLDIAASYSVLSTVTAPIAEAGYYVYPVAVVAQTFKENGLQNAGEIHQVPLAKLQQIFGTDAVLYITVEKYGSVYQVLQSNVIVTVNANLVDAKTGTSLWKGVSTASSAEQQGNSGGGLIGMLVTAAIKQMINSVGDSGYPIARVATSRLLTPTAGGGLLHGPRSPLYGTDAK